MKPTTLTRPADVLAGEASANNINWSDIFAPELGYVFKLADVGPVFRQHAPAERVDFAERHGLKSTRALQAEAEAANPAEQVEDAKLAHAALAAFSAWM